MTSEGGFARRVLGWLLVASFIVEVVLTEIGLRVSRGVGLASILADSHNLEVALAAGLASAIVVALATRYYFAKFGRQIIKEFFLPIFRNVSDRDVVLLAILPAVGEEALFRGLLQSLIGIIPASLIFGFMHTGISRRLLSYSIWTTTVGLLLGVIYMWTGNLWGSILAHAVINTSGVVWIRTQKTNA